VVGMQSSGFSSAFGGAFDLDLRAVFGTFFGGASSAIRFLGEASTSNTGNEASQEFFGTMNRSICDSRSAKNLFERYAASRQESMHDSAHPPSTTNSRFHDISWVNEAYMNNGTYMSDGICMGDKTYMNNGSYMSDGTCMGDKTYIGNGTYMGGGICMGGGMKASLVQDR
jgi:hypothetical protein